MMKKVENLAIEDIISKYKNLVVSIAISYKPNNLSDFEDYIQAGYIGLLKAYRKFDENRNVKFMTFATNNIKYEVLREINKNKNLKDINTSLEHITIEHDFKDFYTLLPDSFTDLDRNIIKLKLNGLNCRQIGEKLGYTKQWINQRYLNIVEQLKELYLND